MKATKKEIIWFIILTSAIILFFATGCKPKQVITEKVVTKVDSTAVTSLKIELQKKTIEVEVLKSDLERSRDEITRLASESSSHTINYDTTAPVNPQTGKYPVLQEIITNTKSQLDKTIKEMETLRQEYNRELNNLESEKSNLTLTVETLKNENRELKEKITPTTGFNFRLFFIGLVVGIVITVIVYLLFRYRNGLPLFRL